RRFIGSGPTSTYPGSLLKTHYRAPHRSAGSGNTCKGETLMTIVTPQQLAEIPLFSNMDEEELSELRSIMTERIFQPKHVIMKEGVPGTAFYIIQQGEVEIWLTDTEGKKVVLDNLGPGK